tara:strand:+ start:8967 stop:9476 length:510 start_codon:yes stop_codon:yes gene_type:complete
MLSLPVGLLLLPVIPHDGPPYPILVDEPFGDCTLSVWADPDVGIGTFYLYLPEENPNLPDLPVVAAWVQPTDERLPAVRHLAELAEPDEPFQRVIHANFDARGPWRVRFEIEDGPSVFELSTEVDVTPPGIGRIDLLWFLTPFLLIAFLWVKTVMQRRAHERLDSSLPS